MRWTLLVACLIGLGLLMLGGWLRRRSLARAGSRDPRLSPVQQSQGAPLQPPDRSREEDRSRSDSGL